MGFNRLSKSDRSWFDAIRASLSRDLLSPAYRRSIPEGADPVVGHCYVATEAAYHAFGKRSGLETYVARLADGGTHWWLMNPATSEVVDLTHEQTRKPFPYVTAGHSKRMRKGAGPRGISRRGQELLRRARRWRAQHAA